VGRFIGIIGGMEDDALDEGAGGFEGIRGEFLIEAGAQCGDGVTVGGGHASIAKRSGGKRKQLDPHNPNQRGLSVSD
jgi:hypothetical protein